MVYFIHVLLTSCEQDQDGTNNNNNNNNNEFHPDPARKMWAKPVWHIPLLCVEWKTPDDGQTNCPKHVEFYSKNKFEKLLHLIGFIITIMHVYCLRCFLKCAFQNSFKWPPLLCSADGRWIEREREKQVWSDCGLILTGGNCSELCNCSVMPEQRTVPA